MLRKRVILFRKRGAADDAVHLQRLGALHRDLRVAVAHVGQFDVADEMIAYPAYVLRRVGGVDDHVVAVLTAAVDDQVVDAAAVLVKHDRITAAAVLHAVKAVAEKIVDVFQRVGPVQARLAHVAAVKHADVLADDHMFLKNTFFELNRQHVACEGNHLSSKFYVAVVKRCLMFHNFFSSLNIFICCNSIEILNIIRLTDIFTLCISGILMQKPLPRRRIGHDAIPFHGRVKPVRQIRPAPA